MKRDSTSITSAPRQVNSSEINLKQHDMSNPNNESTTIVDFPTSIMGTKRYVSDMNVPVTSIVKTLLLTIELRDVSILYFNSFKSTFLKLKV